MMMMYKYRLIPLSPSNRLLGLNVISLVQLLKSSQNDIFHKKGSQMTSATKSFQSDVYHEKCPNWADFISCFRQGRSQRGEIQ